MQREDIQVSAKSIAAAKRRSQNAITMLHEEIQKQKMVNNKLLNDISKSSEEVDACLTRCLGLITAVKRNEGLWEEVGKYVWNDEMTEDDTIVSDRVLTEGLEQSRDICDMFMEGKSNDEIIAKIDDVIGMLEKKER